MTTLKCLYTKKPVAVVLVAFLRAHNKSSDQSWLSISGCNNTVPSLLSKSSVTEKHALIGLKHDMLGNQTFEVLWLLSEILLQSLKVLKFVDVFVKQLRPKLQTGYSSVQES